MSRYNNRAFRKRERRFRVGVDGAEGPPVPIPNTVVKLSCAENTWLEAARENRTMPTQSKQPPKRAVVFLVGAYYEQSE